MKSFTTTKGSIYRYDSFGKTTRFKTTTGQQYEKQDITIFVNLSIQEENLFLNAYRSPQRKERGIEVVVLERESDRKAKIILDVKYVTYPDSLYLAILQKEVAVFTKKASIIPLIGYNVFDMREFQDNQGKLKVERHLGNKVIGIVS